MAADSGGESMEEVTDSEEERWKENERVKKCMLFGLFGHSSFFFTHIPPTNVHFWTAFIL